MHLCLVGQNVCVNLMVKYCQRILPELAIYVRRGWFVMISLTGIYFHIASNYQASPNVLQLLFFKKPDQLHYKVHIIYHGCFTKLNVEKTHISTRFDKDCNNILFNIIIIDIRQQTGVSERSKICCLITYIYLTASIYHILYYLEQ